ncbi:MAG: hypothetical protein A3B37_00350 [Candidatus Sungbacteria bacterium RIFCSPLOWO2_01_FULL_59_16]|uniref:PD-(D/E)XK endonuclease-like domain-containing protein n=1 Tax=Candidatus Sungbacteria bacterium RIFCSPLOWO2_01_FULL_59_16 TaxID=1802280 RepID=A0A1G2LB26_9BACT|nr:MAG: hypothetical protein A3B37_00350 [Candidatus Sungbacteria bacterium RIFCSPLOWO2_01_FULL_59_16]
MRTSYSALETYKLCPQKYKFQEIDRVPAKKSKAALFGTHLHSTLKFMFSRDPLFPTLDEVLNYFREQWPPPEKMEVTPEEKSLYFAAGEEMLKKFYANNAPWNFNVVDLESRFEVLIEDPRRREAHVLAGRIDRIDKTEDGYEVIDYKTSRRMPSQTDVDRDLQMSLYSLGLQRRWPHVKPGEITLSLYFLKHGEKLSTKRSAEATAGTVEDVLRTVTEIQQKLATGERFEPTPGPQCGWCPYKPICPVWKHLYRKRETASGAQEIEAALKEYFALLKNQRENEARMNELKAKISAYMEAEGYERVFGEDGYLARSLQKRFRYDFEKVRAILEPLGKWKEILSADEAKLKAVMKGLPPEAQAEIEAAKVLAREFMVITASAKKIPKPDAPRASRI